MQVKVNCESDRIESADSVAALFSHGALLETPRAVPNPNAQNGITFVLVLHYPENGYCYPSVMRDAEDYCRARAQDCIAVIMDGAGALFGPRANKWLPFNRAYFID